MLRCHNVFLDTLYASRCEKVVAKVFVKYVYYSLDANVKTQT